MALLKHIMSVYNVNATYWKVSNISLNRISGSAEIALSGFYDQVAREVAASPMKTLSYTVPSEIVQEYFPTTIEVAQVYVYVKTLSDFTDAVDV